MHMISSFSSRSLLVLAAGISALLAGPTGQASAQALPPAGFAGFAFGWTATQAQEACEAANHSYTVERVADVVVEKCSAPLTNVGFPAGTEVVLNFCGDRLCRVVVLAHLAAASAEATISATQRRLGQKYGVPVEGASASRRVRAWNWERTGVGGSQDQLAHITLNAPAGSSRGPRLVSLAYSSRRNLDQAEREELEILGAL